MIGNMLNYVSSFIFKENNQNTITTDENTMPEQQINNLNSAKLNTTAISNRNITLNNNLTSVLKSNIDFENTSLILTREDLISNNNELPEDDLQIDLEDYELINNSCIEEANDIDQSYEYRNYFPIKHLYYAYGNIINNYYVKNINYFIANSYSYIFNSNYGLKEINLLIDSFTHQTSINKHIIYTLAKLKKDAFYQLLTSQLIAKFPNTVIKESGFTGIISAIYIHVKTKCHNQNYNSKSVNSLIGLLINSLNYSIKEVSGFFIKKNNIDKLAKSFINNSIAYEIDNLDYADIKDQFIKDAIRHPKISFSLMLEDKKFWDTTTELVQKINLEIDNQQNQLEKYCIGEELFVLYADKIKQFLSRMNCKNQNHLTKLLLIELTQAGVAMHSHIMLAMQTELGEKILHLPKIYKYSSISGYSRKNIIKQINNQLVMTVSLTMTPGLHIQGPLGDPIVEKTPVNITMDLLFDTNEIVNSKYVNIRIETAKNIDCTENL